MKRTIQFKLNRISLTPPGLIPDPAIPESRDQTVVDLGNLFLHHYLDSYPAAPPNPDPTRFEYLDLVSAAADFRFHGFVATSSTVKKRSISTELGQAFCRYMLQEHFNIKYFAHIRDVLDKPAHAALGGVTLRRKGEGDAPDYLCARLGLSPCIVEAKGRFAAITFTNNDFAAWRKQFERVEAFDSSGALRSLKGYIVATRFVTENDSPDKKTTTYLEDPVTPGDGTLSDADSTRLNRFIAASHYSRILSKLDLPLLASALSNGFALTRELTFQVPVWRCMAPPFEGREFIGGIYRTRPGDGPVLTERGWQRSTDLGQGHSAFVGLEVGVASVVAAAARGEWRQLDLVPPMEPSLERGSEFAWLPDGVVATPAEYFLPARLQAL